MKRVWKGSLAVALFLSLILPAAAAGVEAESSFPDIQNHWAESAILTMVDQGYFGGYPDGTFGPNKTISRAEFTSVVVRILGLGGGQAPFADVPADHWAGGAIGAAVEAGIVAAEEYGEVFGPGEPITRLEMAKMLARGLAVDEQYQEVLNAFDNLYNGDLPFVDYRDFADADVPYLALTFGTRIMNGYPDVSFGQDRDATRAEAAVMLYNFLEVRDQEPQDFQYINEMLEITEIGMNATTVSTLQPQIDLTDPETAVIEHSAFTAKLKRAYVIPLIGDTVSMYERKYLWDRSKIDPERLEGKHGYVVGVADVTFHRSGSGWVYLQHSLGLQSGTSLYYFEPEKRFGIETSVMEGDPMYEEGETYEITFYAYYSPDTPHTRYTKFLANNAKSNSGLHYITFYPGQ